jgi:hypothetical protein
LGLIEVQSTLGGGVVEHVGV